MKQSIPNHCLLLTTICCLALSAVAFAFPQETFATSSNAGVSTTSVPPALVKVMIGHVFGPSYASAAKRVANCESRFDPSVQNSTYGASGVFQILPSTWETTSQRHQSRFNARANIRAAYEVFKRDGYSWKEWQCQP